MATFYTDEENDKKTEEVGQPLTQTTAAPAPTTGQAPAASQGAAPAPAAGTGRKPTSSGQFLDIGKYYEAAKDKIPQAQQQLASGLQTKAQEAERNIDQRAASYRQNVQNQGLDAGVFENRGLQGIDQNRFGQLFSSSFRDPGFDVGQQEANLRQAAGNIRATETEAGRRQALRGIANQGYSSGEQALDSFLLRRGERADPVLGRLRQQYGEGHAAAKADAARAYATKMRNDVINQRQAVQDRARQYLASQGSALQQQLGQRRADIQSRYTDNLRAAYEAQLRKGGSAGDFTFDQAMADIGELSNENIGMESLTPAQQAQLTQYQALRGLAGGIGPEVGVSQGGSQLDRARAALIARLSSKQTGAARAAAVERQQQEDAQAQMRIAAKAIAKANREGLPQPTQPKPSKNKEKGRYFGKPDAKPKKTRSGKPNTSTIRRGRRRR